MCNAKTCFTVNIHNVYKESRRLRDNSDRVEDMHIRKAVLCAVVFAVTYVLTVLPVGAFNSRTVEKIIDIPEYHDVVTDTKCRNVESGDPAIHQAAYTPELNRKQAAIAALGMVLGARYAYYDPVNKGGTDFSYGCAR